MATHKITLNVEPALAGNRLRRFPKYAATLGVLTALQLDADALNQVEIYRALSDDSDLDAWNANADFTLNRVDGQVVTELVIQSAIAPSGSPSRYLVNLTSVNFATFRGETLYAELKVGISTYYFSCTIPQVDSATVPVLDRLRVRMALNTEKLTDQSIDVLTSASPVAWRGNDLQFELAAFRDSKVIDISNFTSMTLEVKENTPAGRVGSPLMSKTVSGGAINATLTLAEWQLPAPSSNPPTPGILLHWLGALHPRKGRWNNPSPQLGQASQPWWEWKMTS